MMALVSRKAGVADAVATAMMAAAASVGVEGRVIITSPSPHGGQISFENEVGGDKCVNWQPVPEGTGVSSASGLPAGPVVQPPPPVQGWRAALLGQGFGSPASSMYADASPAGGGRGVSELETRMGLGGVQYSSRPNAWGDGSARASFSGPGPQTSFCGGELAVEGGIPPARQPNSSQRRHQSSTQPQLASSPASIASQATSLSAVTAAAAATGLGMKYVSTRDGSRREVTFRTAVMTGLAPDGGLYIPTQVRSGL